MKIDSIWKSKLERVSNDIVKLAALQIKTMERYDLPKKGGVYLFTTQDDECVYVGKTSDLRRRVFDVHVNGRGKSSLRDALLGQKKTRKISAATTEDEIDDYIEEMFFIRFLVVEDIILRGCIEDYLNAILKPLYSVSLSIK